MVAGPGALVAADPDRWTIRDHELRTDRPIVLGVLNLTPDSFSDGGSLRHVEDVVALGRRILPKADDEATARRCATLALAD